MLKHTEAPALPLPVPPLSCMLPAPSFTGASHGIWLCELIGNTAAIRRYHSQLKASGAPGERRMRLAKQMHRWNGARRAC